MKKIIYVISMVLPLWLGSCTEDIDYTPGQPVSGDCIYASFTTDGEETIVSAADERKVTVTVTRENTNSEVTVPLKVLSQTDDCFQIPSSVTFAAGATTATFDVTFSEVEAEEAYTYSVALDEAAVDSYSEDYITSITGTVVPEANWNITLGQGVYQSALLGPGSCTVLNVDGETWYKVAPFGYPVVFKVNEDNTVRMRSQVLCKATVAAGYPPVEVYISLNQSYGGGVYDPESNTLMMYMDYNCELGALGTGIDYLALPAAQ